MASKIEHERGVESRKLQRRRWVERRWRLPAENRSLLVAMLMVSLTSKQSRGWCEIRMLRASKKSAPPQVRLGSLKHLAEKE